jgi:intracellular multiplication protein IcmL
MDTTVVHMEPAEATGRSRDELEVVYQRTQTWVRTTLRRLTVTLMCVALVLLVSVAGNVSLLIYASSVRYFAVTPDFRVIELPPLDQPVLTAAGLKEWARDTVVRALTLDFANYRRQLGDVESRFTRPAFTSFKEALQSSGIIELITRERLVTSVTTDGAPVIVGEQMFNGAAHWQLEFPLSVSYESSRGVERTQQLLAKVLIARVPATQSIEGVRIAQLVLGSR